MIAALQPIAKYVNGIRYEVVYRYLLMVLVKRDCVGDTFRSFQLKAKYALI